MDRSSNMLEAIVNIDRYLDIGGNDNQHKDDLMLQDDYHQYYDYDSSKILETPHKAQSSTLGSQKSTMNQKRIGKESTARYRQKRKNYQKQLEQSVKRLEKQIICVQMQIKSVKDCLLIQLQNQIKTLHSTQNSQIFEQLQHCVKRSEEDKQPIDEDKVNLLLNTLKYRIGPSGKERQVKLQYYFKNVVNTWFPALHRYLFVTASYQLDIFKTQQKSCLPWTAQLAQKLNLTDQQVKNIKKQEYRFSTMHKNTLQKIITLQQIKRKMREEAILVDHAEDQIRENMSAEQCAKWTVFCEKYKYRKEISLDSTFKPKDSVSRVQYEMERLVFSQKGRKKTYND